MDNLEKMRSTRKWSDDLGAALSDEVLAGASGWLYCDALFIEAKTPESVCNLLIANCEYEGSREALEKRLCEFAESEGYL